MAAIRENSRRIPLIVLSVLLFSGACSEPAQTQLAQPSEAEPSPTASPTPAPTATSTATVTPTVTPTPTPACYGEPGRVEATTYRGSALPEEIPVLVYLPRCYDLLQEALPSVYLLHGKPFNEGHWPELGVVALADERIASGAWPAVILVMPRQPEPLFSGSDGGPGSYEAEMLEGLVPFITQAYRVQSGPDARGIAGISRGGVWALEIAFSNPGVFDRVAALSPALAVNYARPAYDPFGLIEAGADLPSKIYLVAGRGDWALLETERLSAALNSQGVANTVESVEGGHDSVTWEAALPLSLDFIMAGW